jgi:hypothetical protein
MHDLISHLFWACKFPRKHMIIATLLNIGNLKLGNWILFYHKNYMKGSSRI